MKRIFVTGISTEVGKTLASAIITEALEADYWKPIQSGDLDHSDSHKIHDLITNTKTRIYPNSYSLQYPASPHLSASMENIEIDLNKIQEPETDNHLVIEGAGGILVPLNKKDCIIDLIKSNYEIILVSRHYLGSINHTLLTIEALQNRNLNVKGIIFSGDQNPSTEEIIIYKTSIPVIGRIDHEPFFDQTVIRDYAKQFRENLLK